MFTQDQFLQHIKDFPADREKMKNGWLNIKGVEYSLTPMAGGERVAVIYRNVGKSFPDNHAYPILFARDFEDFL